MVVDVIAARTSNFVIGNGSDLAVRDAEDLAQFEAFIANSILIAGFDTGFNLPKKVWGRPDCHVIVLSRHHVEELRLKKAKAIAEGKVSIVGSLDEAFERAEELQRLHPEVFTNKPRIIGGAQVYREILQNRVKERLVDEIRLTIFPFPVEGDKFMPEFEILTDTQGNLLYQLVSREPIANSPLDAELSIYKRSSA